MKIQSFSKALITCSQEKQTRESGSTRKVIGRNGKHKKSDPGGSLFLFESHKRDSQSRSIIKSNQTKFQNGGTMVDQIFDWCVQVLVYWANVLGITYKEINVWVFVIIWPILTIFLIVVTILQRRKIR